MARRWTGYVSERNLSASVKGTSYLSSFGGHLDSLVIFLPHHVLTSSSWKIVPVGASSCTIQQFFNETISKENDSKKKTLKLVAAFLGRPNEPLDKVDTFVPLDMDIQSFGGFLQNHLSSWQRLRLNAFQLNTSSSRQQSLWLPRKKEPSPKNGQAVSC